MKEITKFISMLMFIMLMACTTACGSDDDDNDEPSNGGNITSQLIGTWTNEEGTTLILKSDKTGSMNFPGYGSDTFKNWHLEGNMLEAVATNGSRPGREIFLAYVENFNGSSFFDKSGNHTWRKK